jgi:hypothetical protein
VPDFLVKVSRFMEKFLAKESDMYINQPLACRSTEPAMEEKPHTISASQQGLRQSCRIYIKNCTTESHSASTIKLYLGNHHAEWKTAVVVGDDEIQSPPVYLLSVLSVHLDIFYYY